MLKSIKIFLIVSLLAGGALLVMPHLASAQGVGEICEGVKAASNAGCDGGDKVNTLITNAIKLLSYVIGIVAVIMIMVAGFKYITASGDSNNIASAKNTLIWAIVGLVIAASAQILIAFVADQLPK